MSRPVVAVIGAGFSGALTALHLARDPFGPKVLLIERAPGFGGGTAFGGHAREHLLNVRVGNMSAFPDQPDHFLDWLNARSGEAPATAGSFAPRCVYGAYLQGLVRDAATSSEAAERLVLVTDTVEAVAHGPRGLELELGVGRRLRADAVVLALGNLPPHAPAGATEAALVAAGYVADPWDEAAIGAIGADESVLVIGTGLTMIDVSCRLSAQGHAGPITALSRRGLLPHAHASGPLPAALPAPEGLPLSQTLRAIRRAASETDWRACIDALRPSTQARWTSASETERRRFLRHLRPWWDVHRHRLAPAVAARLDRLRASGGLNIEPGRMLGLDADDAGLIVRWRAREDGREVVRRFDRVVNCTGPAGDLSRTHEPVLARLLAERIARPDPLRLGLDVDADGRVLDADGRPSPDLSAVGPMTRGAFWECTAVPDIRVQAAKLAARLGAELGARAAA